MAYPTGINWLINSQEIGIQPITALSAAGAPNHAIGKIVKARDETLGECEFIYLPGAASTAKGDAVVYDLKAATTTRVVDDTGVGPMAVAMAANTGTTVYGWYAIGGTVPVAAGTIGAADTAVYLSATAGTLDDGDVAGDLVTGAVWGSTDTTGFAYVVLQRPYVSQTSGS